MTERQRARDQIEAMAVSSTHATSLSAARKTRDRLLAYLDSNEPELAAAIRYGVTLQHLDICAVHYGQSVCTCIPDLRVRDEVQ